MAKTQKCVWNRMESTGLILKNRNRKMIDRNRFILYYGRSDEEVQGCREYVKEWWPKETDARLEIANQVCENKFIFNLPWIFFCHNKV